jgi:hypothetical protein
MHDAQLVASQMRETIRHTYLKVDPTR